MGRATQHPSLGYRYAEVYDYFLGNGIREVERLVHTFIEAARVDDLHDDKALLSKLHSICDMTGKS